jgi:hypothetical protein
MAVGRVPASASFLRRPAWRIVALGAPAQPADWRMSPSSLSAPAPAQERHQHAKGCRAGSRGFGHGRLDHTPACLSRPLPLTSTCPPAVRSGPMRAPGGTCRQLEPTRATLEGNDATGREVATVVRPCVVDRAPTIRKPLAAYRASEHGGGTPSSPLALERG